MEAIPQAAGSLSYGLFHSYIMCVSYSGHLLGTVFIHAIWEQVVCAKVREGDKRIVRLKEGNPAGCHVVIVDDLVQSGGTLIECQVDFL